MSHSNEREIKKVAITGASGPIGLALVNCLLEADIEILVFQREISAKKVYFPQDKRLHIVYWRLEDINCYEPTSSDYDVFFHLGWCNTTAQFQNDMFLQNKNVEYTLNAVLLAKKMGCHTFVGIGSQAEIGRFEKPINSMTPCFPETGYGIAKLCAGQMGRILANSLEMEFIWDRVLSVYGKYDNIYSVITSTILKSLKGENIEVTKGEQIFDLLYVDDAAKAIYYSAKKGESGKVYTIASGEERMLKDSIEIVAELAGAKRNPIFGAVPYRDNQNMYMVGDYSELQSDTGWRPETTFEEGIKETVRFYKKWIEQKEEEYRILRKIELDEERKYRESKSISSMFNV